ncbi:dihydrofolate reductase family protein [Actinomadura chibensis]|uniref:Dihydrofolate reductase n=1 Tax=Actinomadura chibensis TaxID=392828 RepID=A0A5D0NVC3_9ACTN|nr:dihydrofolate reductase family protein [Actinomadura chibensis]TYB48149.1 dihydrofolate reductase [Actinomadura chibensis]
MGGDRSFSAAAFVAASLDGYTARADGDVQWVAEHAERAWDDSYREFVADVDTFVMGRGTYEVVATLGPWPFAGKRVAVLSTRLAQAADRRVTVYRELDALVSALGESGARRVCVDGGRVVETFLRAGLLDELTVTTLPVLLGGGLPLSGALDEDVHLTHRTTRVLGTGLVQSTYTVDGS